MRRIDRSELPRFGILLGAMLLELALAPWLSPLPGASLIARAATALVLLAALGAIGLRTIGVVLFARLHPRRCRPIPEANHVVEAGGGVRSARRSNEVEQHPSEFPVRRQLADINLIVTSIMGAVFFTLLLLAGNTMMQAVRERTGEIAVLKTLGFSGGSVLAMVLAESVLLLLIGGVVGLVLASVIGHNRPHGRVLVDAGFLAMSRDRGMSGGPHDYGYGAVCDPVTGAIMEDVMLSSTNQEHGIITARSGEIDFDRFPIGSRVRLLPNHACAAAAAYDRYHVVDGGPEVLAVWDRVNGW